MAELLGAIASGVTLAALFKACVDAFDLIQTSRQKEADFRKLKLRLNIEKCRLYVWGESMGLTDTTEPDQDRPIDKLRFQEVVQEILQLLLQLFQDSDNIRDKYGCRQVNSADLLLDNDQSGPLNNLAASFSNFSIRHSQSARKPTITQNIYWVIHNRKKFGALVAEIKDLMDSLQGITNPTVPIPQQTGTMRRKITTICDTETLSLIAEVCSEDHPDVSDAASTKADTISMASTLRRRVDSWIEGLQGVHTGAEDWETPDLESLTVTELKHKLFEMYQEKKNNRETLGNFSLSPKTRGSPFLEYPEGISPPSHLQPMAPISRISRGDFLSFSLRTRGYPSLEYPEGISPPSHLQPMAPISRISRGDFPSFSPKTHDYPSLEYPEEISPPSHLQHMTSLS